MAKTNTVITSDLSAVREIDFVSRFTNEIGILRDILGSVRMEKHEPGTQLYAKSASVTLNNSSVGEGDEIPYNKVTYKNVPVGTLVFDKQAIGVSLETISKSGYEAAVQQADDDMLFQLRNKIASNFMTFVQTGKLINTTSVTDFQMALAEAQGQVQTKWENMNKGYSEIVGFANVLDAYRYLGAANITTQTAFGMTYLENFLGFTRLFLTSKIPSGKIVATPAENVILYYVDATDNDFSRAGFSFRTDGEENLIAVHVEGNHKTMVSELTTVLGMNLFAEYLDGIAVIDIGTVTFTAVVSPTGNPSEQGYWEQVSGEYVLSTDTTVDATKTYYTRTVGTGA